MFTKTIKQYAQELLGEVGIAINGPNPWDIKVLNEKAYDRIIRQGSLGLGESYMDHWWDCDRLDEFVFRLINGDVEAKIYHRFGIVYKLLNYQLIKPLTRLINFQNKTRAKEVAYKHYDLSNQLFSLMLDPLMIYSCAYWKDSDTLEDAQLAKLALICGKLQLRPGMKVLDIGCGWGGFARYAAQNYGVSVVGITISEEQQKLARQRCADLPIEIRLQDYRDLNEKFDRIVSIGMFEHVGFRNYREFMEISQRCLIDEGLFLLHTIGHNLTTFSGDPWMKKYIFPHGQIPSIAQIGEAYEGLLVMEDWHNFGVYYDKTLLSWYTNFSQHWDDIKNQYDDRFYRMWRYYLLACAGLFRARKLQLWQIVFSNGGMRGGYRSIR